MMWYILVLIDRKVVVGIYDEVLHYNTTVGLSLCFDVFNESKCLNYSSVKMANYMK